MGLRRMGDIWLIIKLASEYRSMREAAIVLADTVKGLLRSLIPMRARCSPRVFGRRRLPSASVSISG